MNYSHENTVLLWTDDQAISETVLKVCNSLKLDPYKVKIPEDILAFPYFFAVIDGKKLNEDILNAIEEVISSENPKEFAILLTRTPTIKIPASIRKLFIFPIEVINYDWIKTNIFNKRFALLRHKNNKRTYDKTVFRIVWILKKLMKKNSILYLDELCREFNVSTKTIKRDFALLESMGEVITYDRLRKGYILEFSTLDIVIDHAG